EQLVLPTTALLVILCTFLRSWAVLAAGVVAALSVAVGVALTARMVTTKGAGTAGRETLET
ncbi:low temperature requirement protein A, partial [Streptomyces sp. NPDC057927]